MGAPASGDDAEKNFGLAKDGFGGCDAIVACHRELATTTKGVARHLGDDEAGESGDRVERSVNGDGDLAGFLRAAEFADVGTGSEDAVTAGDDHYFGRVIAQLVGNCCQLPGDRPR